MNKLFALAEDLKKHNIQVILIQIDEAHSKDWPVGLEEMPESHKTFQDRINRANYFVDNHKPPYETYIDGWDNEFGEKFRAWPDEYYCVNKELEIIGRSEDGLYDENEAVVLVDCVILLENLMRKDDSVTN